MKAGQVYDDQVQMTIIEKDCFDYTICRRTYFGRLVYGYGVIEENTVVLG